MNDIVMRTLKLALEQDRPVIIVYQSGEQISQRRIFVRKIQPEKVTAYCMRARGLRMFKAEGILSAVLAQ